MQITTNRTALEVTRSFLWARIGEREVFVKWRSGLPLREFARQREACGSVQLWGLGIHAVVSR